MGGFFLKSICIKTNNQNFLKNLLKSLDASNINNTIFTHHKFKKYNNIIIHYLNNDTDYFVGKISYLLSSSVIDIYENLILDKIILNNYFYFADFERDEILKICVEELKSQSIVYRLQLIINSFYKYFLTNKSAIIEGFLPFRLSEYINFLNSIVDSSVNKFIIDNEYLEFINILKSYIKDKPIGANLLHLIYTKNSSTILDEDENIIEPEIEIFNNKYISDITFSSNDYALNTLLTIVPKKLMIHTTDTDDEFIHTLQLIFENRVTICN